MKSKYFFGVVVLLTIAIVLLLPGNGNDPAAPDAEDRARAVRERSNAAATSIDGTSPGERESSSRGARVPRMVEPEMAPELPPEQTLEWRITRQQAMINVLQRHLEAAELKWRGATNEADRQILQDQLQILRAELSQQQTGLSKLQEGAR